jgi:hypothetical protein
MSARHRQDVQRRIAGRRLAGAGLAGVTAALAVAPLANADPGTGPQPQPSPNPSPAAGNAAPRHPKAAAVKPAASTTTVTPNFGTRKIRVGVQIKSGAWVPPGTNTGNSQIAIVETGPNAAQAAADNGTSCTTQAGSEDPGSTETYCFFSHTAAQLSSLKKAAEKAGQQVPATTPSVTQDYMAQPGDTVTFTQTTVNGNLVIDSVPQTVGPCVTDQNADFPTCSTAPTDVVFNDAGVPPTATNDTASVRAGKTVDVDVLDNDVTNGAPTTISNVSNPTHGTATIVGSAPAVAAARAAAPANTQSISYKPDAGFVGTDSFKYTISTPNGESTATVTVTVLAPPPTAVDDSASTTSGNSVTINVLGNDNANGGGALNVKSVGRAAHGTATVSNGSVVYTPDSGFVGSDTFTYVAATAFGTATATVTVTVTASHGLASTGSTDARMAEIGILLLITGGAATVVGRRRYRAKHAGLH